MSRRSRSQPKKSQGTRRVVHRYRVWSAGQIEAPGFAEPVSDQHFEKLAKLGVIETDQPIEVRPDEMKPERVQTDET